MHIRKISATSHTPYRDIHVIIISDMQCGFGVNEKIYEGWLSFGYQWWYRVWWMEFFMHCRLCIELLNNLLNSNNVFASRFFAWNQSKPYQTNDVTWSIVNTRSNPKKPKSIPRFVIEISFLEKRKWNQTNDSHSPKKVGLSVGHRLTCLNFHWLHWFSSNRLICNS